MRFAKTIPAALLLAAAGLLGSAAQAQTHGSFVVAQGYEHGADMRRDRDTRRDGDMRHDGAWREREQREVEQLHAQMDRAQRRIEWGERKGQLRRGEAARLQRELQEVRATEARMSQDGRLDRREREILSRKVERLARHIDMEKGR